MRIIAKTKINELSDRYIIDSNVGSKQYEVERRQSSSNEKNFVYSFGRIDVDSRDLRVTGHQQPLTSIILAVTLVAFIQEKENGLS